MGNPLILDNNFSGTLDSDLASYPDGILIPIDKPYRWTSADVVRKVKFTLQRHFHLRNIKVGHAGTLDPLATGILVVCVGKATKLAETLQSHTKEYIAEIELGATTPSYDLEKDVDTIYPFGHITAESIREALAGFIGEQDQVPPLFSAKMIDGVRAYEYARAGEAKELKASRITIEEAELLNFEASSPTGRPRATIRIRCSKGTYIRSFARDLGCALSSGGHLTALRRTLTGVFEIKNAILLENFTSSDNFAR
ncbi:MAG: tRNA pseudouridine(55) synthase TruB [Bacteroidales bacterium]|nr:tRNA pseudouridine(55) synthase TruB [Bacteroidales bacterium]